MKHSSNQAVASNTYVGKDNFSWADSFYHESQQRLRIDPKMSLQLPGAVGSPGATVRIAKFMLLSE